MSKEEIRSKLESLGEEIADLALDALRNNDSASERRLTRARRAVEKAVHLLDDRGGDSDSPDSFPYD